MSLSWRVEIVEEEIRKDMGIEQYGAGRKDWNRLERNIYLNLIRAYKQCYFASKRGDKDITRSRAAYMRLIRDKKPRIFAGFVETVTRIHHSVKSSPSGQKSRL